MGSTSPIQRVLRQVGRFITAGALTVTGAVAMVAGPVGATSLLPSATAAAPPAYLGMLAEPGAAAMYPSGLQYDAVNDRLIVADTGNNRVLFYSLAGAPLGGFGSHGTDNGEFQSPRDVAVDDAGNVYVADAENNRIQAFDPTGHYLWQAGGQGPGTTTLNTPIGVTWDSANDVLLVASTGQDKIKAWNAAGTWQWQSPDLSPNPEPDPNNVTGPRDVERGPDGRLWVTSYEQHQIKVYDIPPSGDWTGHLTPVWVLGDGANGGHGDGQLNFPYNVAFSPNGQIAYVSDTGNGRITRWDISGAQPQWIPGTLEDPNDSDKFYLRRVTVDSAGNIYGADFWGAGIKVFRPDSTNLAAQIEGVVPPPPGVAEPYGVDVAPNGRTYIMDRLNHRIESFQPDGTYITNVGARGTALGTFSWPEMVTASPDNKTVWGIDTRGDRIEQFTADDITPVTGSAKGEHGAAVGQFNYPEGADVDSNGVVWVADTRNNRLQRYNPATDSFLTPIGSKGTGPGQFTQPMGVAVTSNAVYVADTLKNRVQKLALDGTWQATSSAGLGLNEPEGIEVAPDGTVWVADTQNSRLVHLSANLTDLGDGFGSLGTGNYQFFEPHDLAFGNDKMYVADTYNHRVQTYSMPGPVEPPPAALTPAYTSQISDPGGVAPVYPAGVEIVDGTWYVADSGGSRVVTINPTTGAVTPLTSTGLNDPRDLEVDAADPTGLWVLDTGNDRVVRVSRTSGQVTQLTPAGSLGDPYGLANDATRVYVANTYGNTANPAGVKAYNRTGSTVWTRTTCFNKPFDRPRDVGLLDSGEVAVADTDNHRIVVLNAADGSCVREFGQVGTGPGQFKSPRSVTSDGAGGVWVADALNYRVQHLTATGSPLGTQPAARTTPGEGNGQFRSAHCVTPIPGGTEVAVCDTFNFRIQVWNGAGSGPVWQRNVGGTKPANGGFNGAFAVAYGPDGSLYAADWFNHRILKFDANGQYVAQWGGYGQPNGSLIFPRGIVVSPTGEVVVTDSENSRIDLFDSTGGFIRAVKPTGLTLSRPHQTALDGSGGYWIADTNANRVVHVSSTGATLSFPIGGQATNSRPEGIAVDTNGDILVSNTNNNRVERYSATGTLLGTVAARGSADNQVQTPGGLLVTGTGQSRRLWIADKGNDRVVVLDSTNQPETSPFGSFGAGDGQFDTPRGVAYDAANDVIAVADFANNRVSLWDGHGTPPPPDTTNPTVGFTAPASGASLPAGTVNVTGTAADNTSVASVAVAVQRSSDNQWLQSNGTAWGATQQYVGATLAEAGAANTTWSLSFAATAAGSYTMTARATDQAANTAQATRSLTVAAADSTAPDTVLTTPATNAVVAPPTVTATGSATDNVGVASVTILVKNRDTGLWLQTNGTWGSTTTNAGRLATLANPGAATTSWTIDVPLGAGNYLITARAQDAPGNQDATAAQQQFSVRVADSVAPDGTITSPANNAVLPMGPVSMSGNATDNIGVDQVLLAIQDTVTKEYLRTNGTWSAQYGTITATVANRGATSTGWSYTFAPPVARKYAVTAIAQDAASNQDATKPRNTFTVQP
ncbi:MAG: conserved repeat protein [Nocardioides sp.]|nr:conserved repeat protein [Nocardioides sp.]